MAVADSKEKKEKFRAFSGDPAALWPTTWLVATFVESESQQHFRCNQATNKQ